MKLKGLLKKVSVRHRRKDKNYKTPETSYGDISVGILDFSYNEYTNVYDTNVIFYIIIPKQSKDSIEDMKYCLGTLGRACQLHIYENENDILYIFDSTVLDLTTLYCDIDNYGFGYVSTRLVYNTIFKKIIHELKLYKIIQDVDTRRDEDSQIEYFDIHRDVADWFENGTPFNMYNQPCYMQKYVTSLDDTIYGELWETLCDRFNIDKSEYLNFSKTFFLDSNDNVYSVYSKELYKMRINKDEFRDENSTIDILLEKDPDIFNLPYMGDKNLFTFNLSSNQSIESLYNDIDEAID